MFIVPNSLIASVMQLNCEELDIANIYFYQKL